MTLDDVLTLTKQAGITLEARGDVLHVDAPAGRLTPELRDVLIRHKPALLLLLAPPERFVTLKNGPTLPVPALELALRLESRGYRQSVDAAGNYQIEPAAGLTDHDRAAIGRWKHHLGAIVSYTCEVSA